MIYSEKKLYLLHKGDRSMYYMGIDLGGTNIAVAVVNEKMEIVAQGKIPTGAHRTGEEVVADMGKICLETIAKAGLTVDDIEYAGIATPGIADNENGMVVYANNLHFRDFPIAKILQTHVPFKKVYVANDANCAALGEAVAGSAKGVCDVIFITLGTGVGGGVIMNHKIYEGFNHAGAELGHVVIRHNGRPCSCGRKGCWEAYSSATALIRYTKEMMEEHKDSLLWSLTDGKIENVNGKTPFDAAQAGDEAGKKVVDWYVDHLACGLTNMINIFQPEILCIGGGVCAQGENLLVPLRKYIDQEQYAKDLKQKTEVRVASLGNDAGIIGAAALGL